ncbi:MAG TPA: orotate phosphoribosyltransferase [Elusimicrobiales bacterium]|nr:orotate phosphoribosyltransferase [Elusimicrobiales bacterium]
MTSDEKKLHSRLKKCGALLEGHFLLSSGLHSPNYAQCALALKDTALAAGLGARLKKAWKGPKPDVILSPALGGLIIGHETARAFGVDFMFTERDNGAMTLRRGFSLKPGTKVLIVEDVFTTGKSTMEVFETAKKARAEVLGALSIVNRMGERSFYFPSASLLKLDFTAYPAADCPLCAKRVPLVKPGSRTARSAA